MEKTNTIINTTTMEGGINMKENRNAQFITGQGELTERTWYGGRQGDLDGGTWHGGRQGDLDGGTWHGGRQGDLDGGTWHGRRQKNSDIKVRYCESNTVRTARRAVNTGRDLFPP